MRRIVSIALAFVAGAAIPAFAGSSLSESKTSLGLGSVENTALSTWAGTSNITTLGTITTGTWSGTAVGVAKGGTALTATPTNGQVPIGNGTNYTLATLAGTANRVTVTNGAGSITLNAPQDIHTAATPTFGGLKIGNATLDAALKIGINDTTVLSGTNFGNQTLDGIGIYNASTTADSGAVLIFELGSASTAYAGIGGGYVSGGQNSYLAFYTEGSNAVTERGRFTEGGELLIGTTTDNGTFNLQVSGNAYVSGETLHGTTVDNGAYNLQVAGGSYLAGETKTTGSRVVNAAVKLFADSPYTVASTDEVLLVDTVGGAITIAMPAPVVGRLLKIVRHVTGTTGITLDPVDSPAVTINQGTGNKTLGAAIGYTVDCVGATTLEWLCDGIGPL